MTVARTDAWVYARKSNLTADQASIDDQADRGQEACVEHGWTLAGVIREEVSASRFAKKARSGWDELLGLLAAGAVGILILWDSNRGDRTLASWAAFLDLCREQSALVYIVSHERLYNLANHRDWKVLAEDGVANQHFSEQLSVVIKRGKAAARKKGREAGQTPYGYMTCYNEKTGKTAGWVIILEQAEIVAEIITSIGDHMPVRTLRRSLNDRGVPARNGGEWTDPQIRYVAKNPAYAGLVRQADGSLVGRQQQKDGAEWPPIVTRAAWEKAVAVLSSRATGQRPGGAKHLLTGLAQCECGGRLKLGRKGVLACENHDLNVNEEWLDEIVSFTICDWLSQPEARDLYAADDRGRSAKLQSELSVLIDRRKKFREMAAKGSIEPDALADIEADLNPDIMRKEKELGSVRIVPAVADLITAKNIEAAWNGMTIQARREAVAAVTGVVVRKVGRTAPKEARLDAHRVVMDGKPQAPRRKPGGRPA